MMTDPLVYNFQVILGNQYSGQYSMMNIVDGYMQNINISKPKKFLSNINHWYSE